VFHKADGENKVKAKRASHELESALRILRQEEVPMSLVSSLENTGFEDFQKNLDGWLSMRRTTGKLEGRRKKQKLLWLDKAIEQKILFQFRRDMVAQSKLQKIKDEIVAGRAHPVQVLKLI